MKRTAAALLAAVILVPALISVASAQTIWTEFPLRFTRSLANGNANGAIITDSTYKFGSALRTDTTEAFATANIARPEHGAAPALDSVYVMSFMFAPYQTGNGVTTLGGLTIPTISADSIFLDTQVSIDGFNWVTVTPTQVFYTGGAAGTGGPNRGGQVVLECSSNNSFISEYSWVQQGYTAIGSTVPTDQMILGWPLVRFLVGHKNAGAYYAKVGCYNPIQKVVQN